MTLDIEQTLSRELKEVADGLVVPPLPVLPAEQPGSPRRWLPLAAAAAVVIAGAAGFALSRHDDQTVRPAPSPTPTPPHRTATTDTLPRTEPTIPYVVGRALHVGDDRVPGTWWSVDSGPQGWIAIRTDNSWSWGSGSRPVSHRLPLTVDEPPVISPNGLYVAELSTEQGGSLTGFDTRPAGEGLGSVQIDLGDRQQGTAVTVRAVLDDGQVIAQGSRTAVLLAAPRRQRHRRPHQNGSRPGHPGEHARRARRQRRGGRTDVPGRHLRRRHAQPPHRPTPGTTTTSASSTDGSWLAWTPAGARTRGDAGRTAEASRHGR